MKYFCIKMVMRIDKYKHISFRKHAHSCIIKKSQSSPCFDNLQKIHILRAVPAMKKPFSMGLLSQLTLLIALLAMKSYCWEKP